jgi:hypothetical protein
MLCPDALVAFTKLYHERAAAVYRYFYHQIGHVEDARGSLATGRRGSAGGPGVELQPETRLASSQDQRILAIGPYGRGLASHPSVCSGSPP